MKQLLIEVENKKMNRMVQKRLIDLGCRWNCRSKSERTRGFMALPRNLHHRFIYVSLSKTITSGRQLNIVKGGCRKTTLLDLYVGHFIKIFEE